MFNKKPAAKTALDDAIDDAVRNLAGHDSHSAQYAQVVDQLTKLHAIQTDNKSDRVSKDTLALILGNIAGIIVIVGHERAHIITSKALTFVSKLK